MHDLQFCKRIKQSASILHWWSTRGYILSSYKQQKGIRLIQQAATMKAVCIYDKGGPEVLKYETNAAKPKVGDTQVLFKSSAAGINPVDVLMRQGMFLDNAVFPYILGWDAAGVVEAVGKSVKRFKKGDRVYCAGTVSGGYAEYVVSEELQTGHLGDKLTFAQGASVGVPYYTAYNAIVFKAHAKKGETVLIHGASGAVGLAAVQQCKSMGLRVLGTAGTQKGLDLVKRCGAEAVFNHREKGYAEKIKEATKTSGLNIILEMNGGLNLQVDLELISLRGRIVVIGTRQEATINPELFLAKEPIVLGVSLPHSTKEEWEEMTAAIEAGIKSGWVQPVVAREYPLAEAKQAQLDIMDSSLGASGNLVLKI